MKQLSTGIDALYAGIDYLRGTIRRAEVEQCGGIDHLWVQMLGLSRSRGEEHERIGTARIGGFVGLGWRGYAFASSLEGDVLIQVPGAAAEGAIGLWEDVIRPSRIDLQMTGEPLGAVEEMIGAEYEALLRTYQRWPHKGRAPMPKVIKEQATTAYSGKRSRNGVLMRIYNEGYVHQGQDAGLSSTVRYELEYTGKNAVHIYALLRKKEFSPVVIGSIVAGEARYRGATASWYGIGAVQKASRPERERDGTETTVRWIQRQVVPAVKRLSETLQDPSLRQAAQCMVTFVQDVDTSK